MHALHPACSDPPSTPGAACTRHQGPTPKPSPLNPNLLKWAPGVPKAVLPKTVLPYPMELTYTRLLLPMRIVWA